VTATLLLSFLLAAVCGLALAGLYLSWPRSMTAEEWVMHRRQAAAGRRPEAPGLTSQLLGADTRWAARLRWLIGLARADLRLLKLRGHSPIRDEDQLIAGLLRAAALGTVAGIALDVGLWALAGGQALSPTMALLPIATGTLLPVLRWVRLRRRAAEARAAIRRRLPRLLTGSRVLLESGAVTPQQALATAVSVYSDPAADILREVLVDQEIRRVELQEALDQAGRVYGLEPLQRLADAYRVGSRHGIQMADLLSEFALDLRQAEHAAYRERMTRAPVLMTLPTLIFFVLPLLAMVLLLVLSPLQGAFGQL
jgi:Flp pilus assembly protein TadB